MASRVGGLSSLPCGPRPRAAQVSSQNSSSTFPLSVRNGEDVRGELRGLLMTESQRLHVTVSLFCLLDERP